MAGQDINWDRLDKSKFFFVGVGLFSGVTTTLFPLSVIKTRQMAAHNSVAAGLAGTRHVARTIWQQEGIRGFYRGFGTVLVGTMPGRTIYMTSLEMAKSTTHKVGEQFDIAPSLLSGMSSFIGGAAGSLSTQAVVVPIDVVSQRLMVAGGQMPGQHVQGSKSSSRPAASAQQPHSSAPAAVGATPVQQQPVVAAAAGGQQPQQHQQSSSSSNSNSRSFSSVASRSGCQQYSHGSLKSFTTAAAAAPRMNGLQMARLIVQQEGLAGLYRGFWPSVCTFVPSNAIWWGAYGFWRQNMSHWCGLTGSSSNAGSSSMSPVSTGAIVGVQVAAGILSGCTSALITNPLDLVKTRLQVAEPVNGVVPTWGAVLRELLAEEGPRGLLRGVAPRMASSAMWGTAMVSAYEFLKRICALPGTA